MQMGLHETGVLPDRMKHGVVRKCFSVTTDIAKLL